MDGGVRQRRDDPVPGAVGATLSAEGVGPADDWDVHSMRATGSQAIAFDDAGHYHPLPAKQQMLLSGRLALGLEPV